MRVSSKSKGKPKQSERNNWKQFVVLVCLNSPSKRFYTFRPNLNKCVNVCVYVLKCPNVLTYSHTHNSRSLVDFIPFKRL